MIESLVKLTKDSWDSLTPLTIINEYEAGVVLRFGKYHRRAPPGICVKLPQIVGEDLLTVSTAITTMQLDPQTLTTKDGVQIVAIAIIKYKINDVKPYLLEIVDPTDVLNDVVMGAVQQAIAANNFVEITGSIVNLENDVLKNTRKEVNQFGFKIIKITFGTFGKIKSLRLINDSPQLEE